MSRAVGLRFVKQTRHDTRRDIKPQLFCSSVSTLVKLHFNERERALTRYNKLPLHFNLMKLYCKTFSKIVTGFLEPEIITVLITVVTDMHRIIVQQFKDRSLSARQSGPV